MRVLVTGAGGNLGSEAVAALLAAGHAVRTLELDTKLAREVLASSAVEAVWGDVRDADVVARAVAGVDAILHHAFVTPPRSEREPAYARAVNVEGTRLIAEAAQASPQRPRVLFTSSITVFGTTQPHRAPPCTADASVAALDHYSEHKLACEALLRASGLDTCIFRIAVSPPRRPRSGDPEMLRIMFRYALDSRVEFVDPRDVARAEVNALACEAAWNRVLCIGGGPRCQLTHGAIVNGTFERLGIGALPARAFGHEKVYADWLDTRESEALLAYQRHDFEDFLRDITSHLGVKRWGVALMRPFVRRFLLRYAVRS